MATHLPLRLSGDATRIGPRALAGGVLIALVVVGLGVAVAVPEQSLDVVLGTAAVAATILALIQPLVALPLLLFAVPFGGLTRGSSGDTSSDLSFGAAELLLALLTVTWLAQGVRRRRVNIRSGAIVVVALAMVSLAAFSIVYADDRPAAIKESLKWLELVLAVLIVVDLASEPRRARWVIGAMLVAGAAEAAYGAVQFVTDTGPGAFQLSGALRAFGHFDQPNPFAGYLTTILPLAICMALCPANPTRFRWLAVLAAGLLGVGIGLSQSRGAWLGAAVAAICLLLAWSRYTRRLLIPCALGGALALALAVSGLLPAAVLDRLAQTIEYFGVFDVRTVEVTSENWAVVERMAHWQAGWYMFVDHPWLGVGAGNYAQAYPDYFVGTWREALGHAHNYYLNILAELGVLGGGLLLLLLGLAFRQLGGALVRTEALRDTFWRAVLAGVFGGLVVFCVHNLFDSLFVHSVNIQVGVLLGLGLLATDHLLGRAHQAGHGMTLRVDDQQAADDDRRVDAAEPKPPSLSNRFFNLRTLLSFGLGFGILAFLFTRVQIDVGAILDWVRQANPFLLLAAFIAFYATFPVRALRWRRLLDNVELSTHEEGGKRLGIAALSEIIFLGWFANCIVPAKLGDAYRAYLLKLNAGVSFSTTIGTILAERIIDVVVLFLLMLAATGLSFGRAVPAEVLVLMQIGFGLVVLVVVGLIGMRRLRPVVERLLPERLHAQYGRFEHGTLNSFRGIPALVALTGLAWAGEVARLYLVTLSLGLGGIAQSVIVFVALAAALMTTLPLTPAGLGFAEGAIVGVLLLAARAGLAPGVDEHAAASIALLDRGISYWSLIVVGLVVYPLSRRK